MDKRTPEQREADENLTDAIDRVLKTVGFEENFIMSDYLVIAVQSRLDSDGDNETAYSFLYRDGSLPWHTILGLLEVAKARALFQYNRAEE